MNAADLQPPRQRHGFARLLWLALGLLAFQSAAALPVPDWAGRAPTIESVQPLAALARPVAESRAIDRVAVDLGDELLPPGEPLPPSTGALQAGLVARAGRSALPSGRTALPFRARAPPAAA